MKTFSISIKKEISLILMALLITSISYGAVFTASSSGNFSSTATWAGGIVPSSMVMLDQITIPSGVTVNLDTSLILTGISAQLVVEGALTTSNSSAIVLNQGLLIGNGVIVLNTIDVVTGSVFSFTGALTVNTLNVATGFTSSAAIIVNESLILLSGTLTIIANGSLEIGNNGNVYVSGGLLSLGSGGSIGLANNYNVAYTVISSVAGIELTGSGLRDVTVDVNSGNTVTLTNDVSVPGVLSLTSGTLVLAGNDLAINGPVAMSGNGTISSTGASDILINSSGGTGGTIVFSGLNAAVNNLTVNVGSNIEAIINGGINVLGSLQLSSGTLVIHNTNLTVSGSISGSGLLSANSATNLAINTVGVLSNEINFVTGGQQLNNLSISVGTGNSVNLFSDLMVIGTLNFALGTLNIGGNALVIGSAGTITGTGVVSYIITEPGGYVQINVTAGANGYTNFPVGTATGFAPANVQLITGSTGGSVQVGVTNNVMSAGTSGSNLSATHSLVDATWNITSDISSNLNMNLQVMWMTNREVNNFNTNAGYISHYTNGNWDMTATAAITNESGGLFSLQRTGITSLSPFAVLDQNTFTSIAEKSNDIKFEVFPNPATGNINIQNPTASAEPVNMDIYNSIGQLVSNHTLTDAASTISVNDLESGHYYIKFYNNEMSSTKPLIKL